MRKLTVSGVQLSQEVFSVLQHCAINEPLFPNLKTLGFWHATEKLVPFIPLFLSPGNTAISVVFAESPHHHKVVIASMLSTFPTLSPNLQRLALFSLPRDPTITAAVSGVILASNRTALRSLSVDSPLEEGAREVVCKLPNLRALSVIIEGCKSSPTVVLPNLTDLTIKYDHDGALSKWFRGATLGKLETVSFYPGSEQIGDFLEEFERVALSTCTQNTLSRFSLYTSCSWNPNYLSLLPFTQLTSLLIESSCENGCSSTVDDNVITSLAQAMPKLKFLELGDAPCYEIPTGITVKGLAVLAHHCSGLFALRIHFQVNSLIAPPAIDAVTPNAWSGTLQSGCALTDLEVGYIPMAEESMPTVAVTLALIFPHVVSIDYADEGWQKVLDAICLSRRIVNSSSKGHPSPSRIKFIHPPQESHSRVVIN